MTFLAQQRITPVARAVGPNFPGLWEMANVLVIRIARPGRILLVGREWSADRVQPADEFSIAQGIEHRSAYPGHDVHVGHNVRRVRNLDANFRDVRSDRPHAVRDDVHSPARHRTGE